jgi:hypothetical protein
MDAFDLLEAMSVVLRTSLPATVLEPQIRHEIQSRPDSDVAAQ